MIKKRTIGLSLALLAGLAVLAVVVWTGQVGETQANNGPSLSATVDEWKVDLVLSDGPNPWWFRFGGGGCTQVSGTTVSGISGYQPNTYNVVAYSDGGCANQIATTSVTIPTASLAATADEQKVDLVLSDGPNPWWFRFGSHGCTQVSGTTVSGISGYQPGTYNIVAYSNSWCGKQIAAASVTITTASLAATVDGNWWLTATLTDGPSQWWATINDGSCRTITGSSHSGQIYKAGTYIVKAYSDSNCSAQIATSTATIAAASLSATVASDQSVDLSLSNGPASWWHKGAGSSGSCTSASGTTVNDLTGYAVGTHTVTAYSDNACRNDIAEANFTIAHTHTLTPNVGSGNLYLMLAPAYNGDWWYQVDNGSCAKATARYEGPITSVTQGAAYTATAYRDSGCVTAMAPTASLTAPSLSATVNSDQSVDLSLSNYLHGDWWYQNASGACTAASGATVEDLTGYAVGTHTVTAYVEKNCIQWTVATSFTIAHTHTLLVPVNNGATYLRLAHDGDWWYQIDDGSCTKSSARDVGPITGLSAGSHTATAYRDSGCVTAMATATFAIPSLTATVNSNWLLTVTLTDGPSKWWGSSNDKGCAAITGSSHSGKIYEAGTYVVEAHSDSKCTYQIAEVTVTIAAASLSATVASDQSIDLALSDGPGSWWYKTPGSTGSCTSVTGTAVNDLTGYPVGSHTLKAYSDNDCTYQIASATFTIAHTHTLEVSSVINGNATLRPVPTYTGDWWYKVDSGSCTKATARSEKVTGLSAGSHTATAYRDSGCVTAMATKTFTMS